MPVNARLSAVVTTTTARAIAGLCLAATSALLSGCGAGDSAGQDTVVTVTVTPTVTARAAAPTTTAAPTASSTVHSDVVGRKFDLGTITSVQDEGGVPVITFDRWTALGVPDSAVAANGVPIRVHSDAPFQNLNSQTTYRIPVAEGAAFTYRHCVTIGQPPVVRPSSLDEFTRLAGPDKVVLLRLDPSGQVVSAENDPGC